MGADEHMCGHMWLYPRCSKVKNSGGIHIRGKEKGGKGNSFKSFVYFHSHLKA